MRAERKKKKNSMKDRTLYPTIPECIRIHLRMNYSPVKANN